MTTLLLAFLFLAPADKPEGHVETAVPSVPEMNIRLLRLIGFGTVWSISASLLLMRSGLVSLGRQTMKAHTT